MYFYVAPFSIKTCFYENSNVFYLKYETYFHKIVKCSTKFNKNKVSTHWPLFVILFTSAIICKERILHGNETV